MVVISAILNHRCISWNGPNDGLTNGIVTWWVLQEVWSELVLLRSSHQVVDYIGESSWCINSFNDTVNQDHNDVHHDWSMSRLYCLSHFHGIGSNLSGHSWGHNVFKSLIVERHEVVCSIESLSNLVNKDHSGSSITSICSCARSDGWLSLLRGSINLSLSQGDCIDGLIQQLGICCDLGWLIPNNEITVASGLLDNNREVHIVGRIFSSTQFHL